MIRVNENLLVNNDRLASPAYEKEKSTAYLKNGRVYFENLNSYVTYMTISGKVERLSEDIDPNATYYVGVYGKSDKVLKIYKGDGYKTTKTIGDFHYIEIQGDKMKDATYILSNESAKGYIYALGVYKDFLPDIYVPNKNGVKPEKQTLLPPEGYYKEIQAL